MANGDLSQRVRQQRAVVPDDAEIADVATQPHQHRHQHEAVGIEQLCGSPAIARRDQFVAGGEYRDADAPDDVQLREPERSRQRDILRPQTLARSERTMACRNILAGGTHIGAQPQSRRQNDPAVVLDPDVLLHEYGIGAFRHRRAGEDAYHLPRPHRFARRTPPPECGHSR